MMIPDVAERAAELEQLCRATMSGGSTCSVRPQPGGFNLKGAISTSLSISTRFLSATTPTLTSAC